mgnify:CR=1 FL=1
MTAQNIKVGPFTLVALTPDQGFGWAIPGGGYTRNERHAHAVAKRLSRRMSRA